MVAGTEGKRQTEGKEHRDVGKTDGIVQKVNDIRLECVGPGIAAVNRVPQGNDNK